MFLLMSIFVATVLFCVHIYGIAIDPIKRSLRKFKIPTKTPFLGHALEISNTTKFLNVVTDYQKKYGETILLEVGPFETLLVTIDYKLTELIMTCNNNLSKTKIYTFLRPWLGKGLLISDGPHWRKHRKILSPAFHFEILKQFVPVYETVSEILIDKLKGLNNPKSLDIFHIMSLCALDIICETAMGAEINAQTNETSEYVRSVEEMCKIIIARSTSPHKLYDLTFMLTQDYNKQKKYLDILHKYSSDVIKRKHEEKSQAENGTTDKSEDLGIKKRMAFLDLLLKFSDEGNNSLTDEEIRDEVDTFMFAGHDTTSTAMSFALYCLANSPEVQAKAYKEQKDLFGDDKDPVISYQHLQNMKYLELVIKESLRLYPPVPIIGRHITEPVKFDDVIIPSGTDIGILVYGIHRNPKYFPDPEKFYPERFNDLDSKLPFVFVPFSAGPRNCIGQKFAMAEIKSVLSKILRNFELLAAEPQHNLIVASEIVLKSANGVKIGLRERS